LPTREKTFRYTKFEPDAIRAAIGRFDAFIDEQAPPHTSRRRSVTVDPDETWSLDTDAEFFSEYRRNIVSAVYVVSWAQGWSFDLDFGYPDTAVEVTLPKRDQVLAVFEEFEKAQLAGRIPEEDIKPTVFIGHGRDGQWRLLGEYLQTRHNLSINAFELKPRGGFTGKEVLERMVAEASFAVMVHTAEDEQADGGMRARQNVIHETGLFQAHLGYPRVLIVREEGCEDFSNIDGLQEVRFGKGNIKETFGEVIGTIRREFPSS
jgi:hypothetical protein